MQEIGVWPSPAKETSPSAPAATTAATAAPAEPSSASPMKEPLGHNGTLLKARKYLALDASGLVSQLV